MPDFQEFWLVAADPEVRQLTGEHCWAHRTAEEKGGRNVSWKTQRVAFDVHPVLTGCRQEYSLMAVLKKSPLKCLCCLKLARAFQLAVKGCFVHQLGKAGWEKTPNLYPNKRTSPVEWFDFPPGFSAVLARWILRGNSDNCLWALGRCQRWMRGSVGWKEGFAGESARPWRWVKWVRARQNYCHTESMTKMRQESRISTLDNSPKPSSHWFLFFFFFLPKLLFWYLQAKAFLRNKYKNIKHYISVGPLHAKAKVSSILNHC